MDSLARGKYIRISSRKVKLFTSIIKHEPYTKSMAVLDSMPQKAAKIFRNLLKTARANMTVKNPNVDDDALTVKNAFVDKGPHLKRFRAMGRGRAGRILKKNSHITVILTDGKEEE